MKTFLVFYCFIQTFMLVYWLHAMLFNKPTFNHRKSRFVSNWIEGGYILLGIYVVSCLAVSFVLAKAFLLLNFLEQ